MIAIKSMDYNKVSDISFFLLASMDRSSFPFFLSHLLWRRSLTPKFPVGRKLLRRIYFLFTYPHLILLFNGVCGIP